MNQDRELDVVVEVDLLILARVFNIAEWISHEIKFLSLTIGEGLNTRHVVQVETNVIVIGDFAFETLYVLLVKVLCTQNLAGLSDVHEDLVWGQLLPGTGENLSKVEMLVGSNFVSSLHIFAGETLWDGVVVVWKLILCGIELGGEDL
mmetsp:Transcript_8476/g.17187  ORF Transcript_8476/g.17187 Transcript_8476/m.17187 type:complete len:148 (-) Transcript_8476:225-668(-)